MGIQLVNGHQRARSRLLATSVSDVLLLMSDTTHLLHLELVSLGPVLHPHVMSIADPGPKRLGQLRHDPLVDNSHLAT